MPKGKAADVTADGLWLQYNEVSDHSESQTTCD